MASSDTGRIFVVVTMNKGGIVKTCKVITSESEFMAPSVHEIVTAGYKSPTNGESTPDPKNHTALKAECFRVANKLGEINIPE